MPHEFDEREQEIRMAANTMEQMHDLRKNEELFRDAKRELHKRARAAVAASEEAGSVRDAIEAQNALDNPMGQIGEGAS